MSKEISLRNRIRDIKTKGIEPVRIGESIFYEIMVNRNRQESVYSKGLIKRFQNYELNALERSIDNLLDDNFESDLSDDLLEVLEKKHSMSHINFVYDGIKFLNTRRVSYNDINAFLGDKMLNLSRRLPPGKTEYMTYLLSIRNDIADRYNIIFD